MPATPLPPNEAARLALLHAMQLLDTAPEEVFDRITRLVARVLDMPTAAVSLIDRDRQWFKSKVGMDASESPRSIAFCAHTILQSDPLVVADPLHDPRFADHPMVDRDPGVRFYAGVPILSADGLALGTLCVFDWAPREFSAEDLQVFTDFAALIRREILNREALLISGDISQQSQRALAVSEMQMRAVFDQAAVGIARIGLNGEDLQVNHKFCDIVGYSESELSTIKYRSIKPVDDLERDRDLIQQLCDGRLPQFSVERQYVHKSGELIWVNVASSLVRDGDGEPLYIINVIEDIQARKQAEAALRELSFDLENQVQERTAQFRQSELALRHSQVQMQAIADNIPAVISYVDRAGYLRFVNEGHRTLLGVDPATWRDRPLIDVVSAIQREATLVMHEQVLRGAKIQRDVHDPARDVYWQMRLEPDLCDGEVVGYFSILTDITRIKQAELEHQRDAHRDELTGLPNRRALMRRLPDAIAHAHHGAQTFGILFLDLDGFKQVNDGFGHDAGDDLLRQFAQRLSRCVRNSDLVARLAGDEFVVVAENLIDGENDARRMARKITAALAAPFQLAGRDYRISASIGVKIFQRGDTAESLLAAADQAMYIVKRGQTLAPID